MSSEGWQCPKCGKVFAPWVWECSYCNTERLSNMQESETKAEDGVIYRRMVSIDGRDKPKATLTKALEALLTADSCPFFKRTEYGLPRCTAFPEKPRCNCDGKATKCDFSTAIREGGEPV